MGTLSGPDDPDVKITNRKDDVVNFYDLLEVSSKSGTKCLEIRDNLKIKQKQLQSQIIKLLQQRARFIDAKDIITKLTDPEKTALVDFINEYSEKEPELNQYHEDLSKARTVSPTDQKKAKAENEIDIGLPFLKTLREYDYIIAKMKMEEQRVAALVRKYEVQYKKLSDNVINKNSEYNQHQLVVDEYNHLIGVLIDLIDIIKGIPNDLSTSDAVADFTKKLNYRSFQYNTKRKALIETAKGSIVDPNFPSGDTVLELINYLQFYLGENLTDLLSVGVAKKDDSLKQLGKFRDTLTKDKLDSIEGLSKILSSGEDVDNEKVKKLKQQISNHISGDALNNIVAKDFTPNFLRGKVQKLREVINAKINKFMESLKLVDGDWTKLTTGTQKEFNFFIKKMVTLDKNFVNAQNALYGDYRKSLEEFWRNRIRKKYGGNVPFCDEEQVISGSTTTFKRKTDVIYVNGVAMDKRVIQAQKMRDQLLANDPELRI